MKKWLLSFVAIALTAACNSYTSKDQGGAALSTTNSPAYADIQSQILQPYCLSCHSAAGGNLGGINLETYANTVTYISQIQHAVIVKQSMPPGTPLSSGLQQLLATWISDGAPQNSVPVNQEERRAAETASPAEPSEDLQPTFSSISQNILTPKCVMCHGTDGDTPITNYDYLIKSKWIVPGDLTKSALYGSIKVGEMPPSGSGTLTQTEIDTVGAWITDGAKNN